MPLVLNEEQNMLRDAAKDFCTNNTPITQLRRLRDEKDETGFDRGTWRQMVELGWAGITIPEDVGGLGFGYMGMGVVMEECGRTLACSPLFATAVLGAGAIQHGGTEELKGELLHRLQEVNCCSHWRWRKHRITIPMAPKQRQRNPAMDIELPAASGSCWMACCRQDCGRSKIIR